MKKKEMDSQSFIFMLSLNIFKEENKFGVTTQTTKKGARALEIIAFDLAVSVHSLFNYINTATSPTLYWDIHPCVYLGFHFLCWMIHGMWVQPVE